ncbi:MAG: hypothetical protein HZA54_19915 [Planctomycetes bacterium]|nr:hypothetical protein [Planctomycetota bacterium]
MSDDHIVTGVRSAAMPEGYRTQSADTSYDAEVFLFDRLRTLAVWEKLGRMRGLCRALDRLAEARILAQEPSATPEERRFRLAALHLDRETLTRVLGRLAQARGR